MASEISRSEDFKTGEVIFAFTQNLFEPQEMENGTEKYNATLLIKKGADMSPYEKAALQAAEAKWPGKAAQFFKDGIIKNPFLDGDGPQGKSKKTGETHRGFAGHTFIRVQSGKDFRPKIVDRKLLPVVDKADFPSGSKGFAVICALAWDHPKSGKGVSFSISMAQISKVATGEEVLGGAGSGSPEDFFEKIDDEGPAPDTKGKGAESLFG